MPRFDVYANPETVERRQTPYLLDVQNDFIGLYRMPPTPSRRHRPVAKRPWADRPASSLREHRLDIQNALGALFGTH